MVKFFKNGNIDVTIEKTKSVKVAINAILDQTSLFKSGKGETSLSQGIEYTDRNGYYYLINTEMVKKAMNTGKIKLVKTRIEKNEVKYTMQDLYSWAKENLSKDEWELFRDTLECYEGVAESFEDYKMTRGEVCDFMSVVGKNPWSVDPMEKKRHTADLLRVDKEGKGVKPVNYLDDLQVIRLKNCKITVLNDRVVCKLNHGRGTKSFNVSRDLTRKLLAYHKKNLLVNWHDVKTVLELPIDPYQK